MRRRRRQPDGGTLGPAGWLFAELALLLVVIVIGSEVPKIRPAADVASPSTPPTTTEPPRPQGLRLTPQSFVMPVVPDHAVVEVFRERLTATVGPDAQVGLVLLFGRPRNGRLEDGVVVSEHLKSIIEPVDIPQLRSRADMRAYVGAQSGEEGQVLVELFLMTGPS
ncbi:hypothetical protein ABZ816_34140 [Actinosynnema sp. NPDC047251]|uniref:hypothetical protein n=1 Tax=Saccharothrix espanaensis TaxID=103731 RepID=UPI0002FD7043|nr:hypothetical protein [Saccharothrix espanaensis]